MPHSSLVVSSKYWVVSSKYWVVSIPLFSHQIWNPTSEIQKMPHSIRNLGTLRKIFQKEDYCFNRSMPHSIRNCTSSALCSCLFVSIGQCLIQLEMNSRNMFPEKTNDCFNRSMPHSIRNSKKCRCKKHKSFQSVNASFN